MLKDLVIGYIDRYNWDTIQYWIVSLTQCGFVGDKVLIVGNNIDNEVINRIELFGITVVRETQGIHATPYVKRFYDIYNYIQQGNYNYVVTTDVKDVVFQRNPVEFLKIHDDKELIFASESMKYKDEAWGTRNFIESFGNTLFDIHKEQEIFNVGVIAGKSKAVSGLLKSIFDMSMALGIPVCDQSTFNVIIQSEYYQKNSLYARVSDGWATQMGTTNDPNTSHYLPVLLEQPPVIIDNIAQTSSGSDFYIIHQYDRVPVFRERLREKYSMKTTIVTAFYDIGRADWKDYNRSADQYFEWFSNLARLDNEMIIFTSSEYADRVQQLRNGKPTQVVVLDLLTEFADLYQRICAVHADEEYKSKINPAVANSPEYWNSLYTLVMYSKINLMNRASKLAPADFVAWVDFGCCRRTDFIHSDKWQPMFDLNKIHVFGFNELSQDISIEQTLANNTVHITGSHIVIPNRIIEEVHQLSVTEIEKLIQQKLVDEDQTMMTSVYLSFPNKFQMHVIQEWFNAMREYN